MKILNLYAGIGGNRKLWGDKHEVTAIELDPKIAKIYQDFFPKDKVIVTDAHQYLLEHYKEFDFIWSSPPCPTHSKMQRTFVFSEAPQNKSRKAVYPDMKLYEEIILLTHFFKKKFVIENVQGYYEPLIKPQKSHRHFFWCNFIISDIELEPVMIQEKSEYYEKLYGFEINSYALDKPKAQILRNCVHPKLGLHIFKCAFKDIQVTL